MGGGRKWLQNKENLSSNRCDWGLGRRLKTRKLLKTVDVDALDRVAAGLPVFM